MNLSPFFIMKMTWNFSPIIWSWYGSILKITHAIHPNLFTQTHKSIRRPTPISYSSLFCMTDILIPALNINPTATALLFHQAKELHAMLFVLHSNFSEGTAPITSDDLLVVLDSGCTCTISFNKNNFVGPIYPVQYIKLKGIAFGLYIKDVGQVWWKFLKKKVNTFAFQSHASMCPMLLCICFHCSNSLINMVQVLPVVPELVMVKMH